MLAAIVESMSLLLAIGSRKCGTFSALVVMAAAAVGGALVKLVDMDSMCVPATGSTTSASQSDYDL